MFSSSQVPVVYTLPFRSTTAVFGCGRTKMLLAYASHLWCLDHYLKRNRRVQPCTSGSILRLHGKRKMPVAYVHTVCTVVGQPGLIHVHEPYIYQYNLAIHHSSTWLVQQRSVPCRSRSVCWQFCFFLVVATTKPRQGWRLAIGAKCLHSLPSFLANAVTRSWKKRIVEWESGVSGRLPTKTRMESAVRAGQGRYNSCQGMEDCHALLYRRKRQYHVSKHDS